MEHFRIPTRDHRRAARSKNYRWSCHAQVLIRRRDLTVVATAAGGSGNRNDTIHYRGSTIEAQCTQHARVLADGGNRGIPELITPRVSRQPNPSQPSLKNWPGLRDHRRRGCHLADTVSAVAFLHNLHVGELRDNP